jgi:hypothetical protein
MRGNFNTKHWNSIAQSLYRYVIEKAEFEERKSRRDEAIHHLAHEKRHDKGRGKQKQL